MKDKIPGNHAEAKATRTDPKPGEVTSQNLVRGEMWFYFMGHARAAKLGAQSRTSTLLAGWHKSRVTKQVQDKCQLEITHESTNGSIKLDTLLDLNVQLLHLGGRNGGHGVDMGALAN